MVKETYVVEPLGPRVYGSVGGYWEMLVVSSRERFKGRIRLLFVGRMSSWVCGGVSGDDKVRVCSRCH